MDGAHGDEGFAFSMYKYQIPKQDLITFTSFDFSKIRKNAFYTLSEAHRDDFRNNRGILAQNDRSELLCAACNQLFEDCEQLIQISESHCYHLTCFRCFKCRNILVDNIYLRGIGRTIYCPRHFMELYHPRCSSCDELILDEECLEAENKMWHLEHFRCHVCRGSLGQIQYSMRGDKPHCILCLRKNIEKRKSDMMDECKNCSKCVACGAYFSGDAALFGNNRCQKCESVRKGNSAEIYENIDKIMPQVIPKKWLLKRTGENGKEMEIPATQDVYSCGSSSEMSSLQNVWIEEDKLKKFYVKNKKKVNICRVS